MPLLRYHASSQVLASEVQGEIIVLHLTDGNYFGLNSGAARIWNLLQRGVSLAEMVSFTTSRYEVSSEQCERDLIALLDDLLDHELVRTEVVMDANP